MINNKQNNSKWWQWLLIFIGGLLVLLGIPYLLNVVILSEQRFAIVGEGKDWLLFWVAWLGVIASIFVVLVACLSLIQNKKQSNKQVDRENLRNLIEAFIAYSQATNLNNISSIYGSYGIRARNDNEVNVIRSQGYQLKTTANGAILRLLSLINNDMADSTKFKCLLEIVNGNYIGFCDELCKISINNNSNYVPPVLAREYSNNLEKEFNNFIKAEKTRIDKY